MMQRHTGIGRERRRMGRELRAGVLVVAMWLAVGGGCVRRTVTINTTPQGAAVVLNDQQVGTSPVAVDFLWYGDYDVVLRKDGYRTLKTNHRLHTPWYQLPGIDFVVEILPFTLHDQQEMSFVMEEAQPVDRETLLKDAVEFRERTLFGSE